MISHISLRPFQFSSFFLFSLCSLDLDSDNHLSSILLMHSSANTNLLLGLSEYFLLSFKTPMFPFFNNFYFFNTIFNLMRYGYHTSFTSVIIVSFHYLIIFIIDDLNFFPLNLISGFCQRPCVLPAFIVVYGSCFYVSLYVS